MGKYDLYIDSWRKKLAQERSALKKRAEEMRKIAAQCADLLAMRYGVKRVYLFGSLLKNRFVHDRSDIDLAVEGLPSLVYFSASADVWDIASPDITIDLVPLEDAYSELRDYILKEGELLYERK
ncbi:MAG TPA: nucleotidyltransferase domain-containing protein [bacterium]